ncbi:restriction endonuclease [Subtercola sp. PAMC28395]|uniref:restriction endonuclease n=1 Tax=Subtercola sp. PAMC28395 TaxID=2846775 RepID=UPI001C0ACAA2|nr:restriction endonuclease [Subtercola sp. PAMC28395]QWT24212.1 restriction endonuclease [Subtercola sp. PAMC28395]
MQRLRESHPAFFEEAVVALLLKMGYGGAEQRGKRIGGTGDEGIDGVIDQDALGLDRIYLQAKRYKQGNNISRETIQAFVGALHGFGASRGVFITTSAFTSAAVAYANGVPIRVILIDGDRLVNLMIKYRVGVQARQTYAVVEIDSDFFD